VPPSDVQPVDPRFEALAQSAPDAILTIDEHSTILSANPATERIFGWSPAELVGKSLDVLMPERMRARHHTGIARYLRTGRRNIPWTGAELIGLTRDGRELPLEISFGEFTDGSGRRVFSGFVRDVSERVRQQRELHEARIAAETAWRELARLGRITDVALARVTYDEMVHELLRRLRAELGADMATLLLLDAAKRELFVYAADGMPPEVQHDLRIPLGESVAGRVAATDKPMVVEDLASVYLVTPMLREYIHSMAAIPVRGEGGVIGVLDVGSRAPRKFSDADVRLLEIVAERMAGVLARTRLYDDLRRVNQQLEERAREEQSLRTLAQAISGAVGVREVMQQVVEGALAVSDAAGAYVEQVVGSNREVEVVAAGGERTPPVGQCVPYPGSLTEEIITRGKPIFLTRMEGIGSAMAPYLDEHCHGCSVLVVPLLADRAALGALVLMRKPDELEFEVEIVTRVHTLADLASIALQRLAALAESERRRTEAEAAVRSRDEVLSVVSHDLRNPMSTIAMSASLLKDPEITLSDEQQQLQFDIIARSAQRMNRLIQDLLDVARIEGGRLTITCRCEEPAALATEACEAFRSIATEQEQQLDCEIPAGLRGVFVDRDRILQVLSNNLNNAVKFTPKGGRIVVRLSPDDDGGVTYSVSDTGPGIAPEDQPHVFSRFWQARRTAHLGTGLGLAIASGIATAHHGAVWVESTDGSGSTFYFKLPRAKECS